MVDMVDMTDMIKSILWVYLSETRELFYTAEGSQQAMAVATTASTWAPSQVDCIIVDLGASDGLHHVTCNKGEHHIRRMTTGPVTMEYKKESDYKEEKA